MTGVLEEKGEAAGGTGTEGGRPCWEGGGLERCSASPGPQAAGHPQKLVRDLGQSPPQTLQREPVPLICDLGLLASRINLWPHSPFLFVVVALVK